MTPAEWWMLYEFEQPAGKLASHKPMRGRITPDMLIASARVAEEG